MIVKSRATALALIPRANSIFLPVLLGSAFLVSVLMVVLAPHLAFMLLGSGVGLFLISWIEAKSPNFRICGIKLSLILVSLLVTALSVFYLSDSASAIFLDAAQTKAKDLVTNFAGGGGGNANYTTFIDGIFILIRIVVVCLISFLVIQIFNQLRQDDEWKPLLATLVVVCLALMGIEGLTNIVLN
ncbi:hypothetical protein [Merismopedia glauca]|uniref:Uncharacterized protein n=1 Tax=Merismopedia glauca CCAP 1448/3 TaxID=1296344 RepID=A0A2T1C3C0_9CYAN|nr:hypothetical protein [Merismopedia glauca]PSB02762.1 hypothetical protein C7B64_11460 [Merismopedia glauca CCAP 1448/3]